MVKERTDDGKVIMIPTIAEGLKIDKEDTFARSTFKHVYCAVFALKYFH